MGISNIWDYFDPYRKYQNFSRLIQPILIGRLISYYTSDQDGISRNEAYIYSSAIVLTSFLYILLGHSYFLGLWHLGMKIRIACSSLIYRKSLKLSQTSLAETIIGQVINLLSNDMSRFDYGVLQTHFLWMGPLEILIILGLLLWMLEASAVIGIGILLAFIPVQMIVSKKIGEFRMRTAKQTDQRVRLMNEIITGIKIIKMYTWEKPFTKLIEMARKLEMDQIKINLYLRALITSCKLYLSRSALFFCILVRVLIGGTLTPDYVYVLSSFYEVIRLGSVIFLPNGMMLLGEMTTSVERIREFLLQPEILTKNSATSSENITLSSVSVQWDKTSTDSTLTDVSLTIEPKKLVAIIGPVGSGKSTILQTIIGEVALQGNLNVGGTISYCSQKPWLFTGSIRENILFGEDYDKRKYSEVVRVCALEHDLSVLPHGDQTLVATLSGGQKARINLARAVYKEADFYLLDDPLSAVDVNVGKHIFQNCINGYLRNKGRVMVTHQLQYLNNCDVIYLIQNGKILFDGGFENLKAYDHDFVKFLEEQTQNKSGDETDNMTGLIENQEKKSKDNEETIQDGIVSNKVYGDYFKASGSLLVCVVVIFLHAIVQAVGSGTDYFLSHWVNLEQDNFVQQSLTRSQCLYIYIGLIVFLIFVAIYCALRFFNFCYTTSTNLHSTMFSKIVYSPMRFFALNPSGRIMNRFSKDIGLIDESLPVTMMDTIETGFNVIAIVVIISIINPWMLVPTMLMFVLFYCYRRVYLETSRNLKRIEGRTRSPIYNHALSSLEGLSTIRAFKAENNLKNEFDQHQDLHSSSFYMFLACDGAFGFWLDFTCVIYLGLVTLSFLFIGSENYGANVGLSITQSIMMIGLLQWGMKLSADLENQMTSVERVVEYTQLHSEDNKGTKKLTKTWPDEAKIEFQSVSLRYSNKDSFVLKNLNFVILPKEKIGIVGRTGAGKSSLVSAFFRLAYTQGDIIIDDVYIQTLPLENLRSKISIIPQEPVLFSGTIRYNLNPFGEYEDNQLWDALEEVELKNFVSDLPDGLYNTLSEGGSNLSVGQRQLLCLARALLRMNKILILDEATANVDPRTDELIQKTIKKKFQDCTVLTIAHRLNTVMDSDRILVMEDGEVMEFDTPEKLLENTNGVFYKLVHENGGDVYKN